MERKVLSYASLNHLSTWKVCYGRAIFQMAGVQKESKIGTDRTVEEIYKVNRENGELISIQNQ